MCGMSTKTISLVEWSDVSCEKRYFKIGIEDKPGIPVKDLVRESSIMPPSRLTSPSFKRISFSILRWPMTGWLMPPMLTYESTSDTSIDNFMEISRPAWTRGVISMFTPTSRY